jgi:hypothetical protein
MRDRGRYLKGQFKIEQGLAELLTKTTQEIFEYARRWLG